MKLDVIDQSATKLVAYVDGANATLLHIVMRKVQEQKGVVSAVFTQEHPLSAKPKILVETDKGVTPKSVLTSAIDAVQKDYVEFAKQFSKAFA